MREFMTKWGVDIASITEPNVHWGKVHKSDNWHERTSGWFQSKRLALLYHTERGRLATINQYGGTMTLCRDDISHRAVESGYDSTGMGRWSSIRFRGKRSNVTRVFTTYCPNKSTNGPNTVYSQQLQTLGRDPIACFWEDLGKEIESCQLEGEQIVLLGDWNTDSNDAKFQRWKSKLGLVDPIAKKHGSNGPGTYNRGNRIIDSILVSPTLRYGGCGYLSFGMLPGDHRGLWIDIYLNSFIGYRAPSIPSYKARRLKLHDPRVLARYKEVLEDELAEQGVFKRVKDLQSKVQLLGCFDNKCKRDYEKIDRIRTLAMEKAERKCRKLHMGAVQWSPTLQRARNEILLWTLVIRKIKGRKVGARRILRLKKKLGIDHTLVSLAEAEHLLDLAYKKYKITKKQDSKLRSSFIEELAQARADEGNTSLAVELRNMAKQEEQRSTARHIKSVLGKYSRTGTSKIEIQFEDGTIREITEPKEMVKHIIKKNRGTYNQNADCPLLAKSLIDDLGLLGDGPYIDQVLDGTYIPPEGTSWATQRWLQQMKMPNPAVRSEISTSLQEYRHGWKLAKERTATGDLHVGHFKASATHRRIGWLNFVMAVLPYTAGYMPKRWRKGTDIMLLKKEELFLIDKLRTIVLYEADFNSENKRLGRDAMKLAISKNLIAKEQFSRPGRSAQENTLCKRLIFDYCRAKKLPYAMCACDLKSCYDRIVHTAASIALQRIGVPRGKIKVMFGAVQKLVHHVRTLFGTSKESYGGESDDTFDLPPQGMGQGHGSGPTIWSVLSSTVFEILHAEGFASDFSFSISKGLFHLCGFSYVDDCDLICHGETIDIVAEKLQSMLTMWDNLMEVNGGAIAPDKCWWYLVDFSWKDGKWKMSNAGDQKELWVRDKDKKLCSLPHLPISEAREMLGVFLAPDGNEKKQLSVLSTKAHDWMDFVRVGGLDWSSTWIALKTTIWKSLEYPLPTTTFTAHEISSITGPLYRTVLPRCGYASSFPRDVLHGPTSLQGLGLNNLYDKQFIRHVKDILDYCHRKSTSGQIISSAIEAIKLEAGIGGALFKSKYNVRYYNTTKSWVASTKAYCLKNKITFDEKIGNLSLQRKNDRFIMEACMDRRYPLATLRTINRCRLFLQVTTLSDIASGDGRYLNKDALNGVKYKCNSYRWPKQSNPPPRDWKIWTYCIQEIFAPEHNIISYPLGPWLTDSRHEHYTEWEWWIDKKGNLIRVNDDVWELYQQPEESRRYPSRILTRGFKLVQSIPTTEPTPAWFTLLYCERTTVEISPDGRLSHSGSMPIDESVKWVLDWLLPDYNLPPQRHGDSPLLQIEDEWITQYLKQHIPLKSIIKLLFEGELVGVSDGSFHPKRRTGSMAWCFATKDGTIVVEGGGLVPGGRASQGSYRSEAAGLLGLVTILKRIEDLHHGPAAPFEIVLACDGESALYRSLSHHRDKLNTSVKHADIISRTHDRKDSALASLKPIHVLGHRDDLSEDLTILERLNVKMDKLAKAIMLKNTTTISEMM